MIKYINKTYFVSFKNILSYLRILPALLARDKSYGDSTQPKLQLYCYQWESFICKSLQILKTTKYRTTSKEKKNITQH